MKNTPQQMDDWQESIGLPAGSPERGDSLGRAGVQKHSNGRASKAVLFFLSLSALSSISYATNGDLLTGEGPVSDALGGVGVAAPQDAITTISANPAALSLRDGVAAPVDQFVTNANGKSVIQQTSDLHGVEVDVDANIFLPHVSGQVNGVNASGKGIVYPIPEIGIAVPLTKDRAWYFGLGVYGSSGLGVDYRSTALNNNQYYNFGGGNYAPLSAGNYTYYSNLKFVPSLAYRISDQWSVGVGVQVDYATLDLGSGSTSGWGLGVQPGIVYHPNDKLSFGLSYTSPQPVTFNNVSDFTGNGKLDNLKLETPQQIVLGGATKLFNDRLLLESDLKWINWANASGYNDFGWKNEWVASLGAQYALIPKKLFLRAGYNFGNNPVSSTSGFNGAYSPNNTTSVQGNKIQNYYYQSFRTVGFPAVVENHISVGVGYAFNEHFTANLAYVHGFANTITQNGSNLLGQPTSIGSKLSEDSIEVGLTWNY